MLAGGVIGVADSAGRLAPPEGTPSERVSFCAPVAVASSAHTGFSEWSMPV